MNIIEVSKIHAQMLKEHAENPCLILPTQKVSIKFENLCVSRITNW